MAEYDPRIRTRTLARIAGPYMLVIGVTLLTRQSLFSEMLPSFMDNSALVLSTGAFTLIMGLTMLTAHHHWSSAPAIAITFIGFAARAQRRLADDRARMGRSDDRGHGRRAMGAHCIGRVRASLGRLAHLRRLVCQARRLGLHHAHISRGAASRG
jgi:hypothetical protein